MSILVTVTVIYFSSGWSAVGFQRVNGTAVLLLGRIKGNVMLRQERIYIYYKISLLVYYWHVKH